MDLNVYSLPISLLRQYCFCPRIPYFYICRSLDSINGIWVKEGIISHKKQEMLLRRRKLKNFGCDQITEIRYDFSVKSKKLMIHGICDALIYTEKEIIPLEFKTTEHFVLTKGMRLQLCAYSLALEEMLNKHIGRGFILHGSRGRTVEIKITPELRREVFDVIRNIHKLTEECVFPASSACDAQCSQCEFQNFCADRY